MASWKLRTVDVAVRHPPGRIEVRFSRRTNSHPSARHFAIISVSCFAASAAILLAAIRNHLKGRPGDEIIVTDIDTGFLTTADRKSREQIPRLRLNVQDGHFFERYVVKGEIDLAPSAHSHRLIEGAADLARQHVLNLVRPHDPKNHGDALNQWIDYLQHRAIVVLLKVPSAVNAYRMFETLNDRGLKTSQGDLVKNYMFGQAGPRLPEAQHRLSRRDIATEAANKDGGAEPPAGR